MGRPGLVGTMARTAVVAGTATAVVGGMSRHQQAKAQDAAQLQQLQAQQAAADQQAAVDAAVADALAKQAPAAPAAAPAAAGGADPVAELQKLADMKAQGLLSDEEFAAMKAKLIGG
jgi:hypothetical protein